MTITSAPTPFNLIMISAEFEHGGNLTHRHFDGHPNCLTYGFESQIGTKFSRNILCPSIHPVRYGYPEFPEGTSYERAFDLLWDEECKAYLRNPQRSKFRDCGMVMSEEKRREAFLRHTTDPLAIRHLKGFRQGVIEAYFRSFFDAWENLNHSGRETHYVGYNPGMVAETDKLFADFPTAHIIHVVRNPFSAYADYLRRPFPQQSLEEYLLPYNVAHGLAYGYRAKYAGRFHVVRLEDLLANRRAALEPILAQIGLPWDDALNYPSFNGRELTTLPPWGTVEKPTTEYNLAQARNLPVDIRTRIAKEAQLIIHAFDYEDLAYTLQQ